MADCASISATELEQMFKDHYEGLCRYASTILKNQADAEDIVQHLFIKLWEKRSEIEILSNVKSYLYRSTYNASLNAVKRSKRQVLFGSMESEDEPVSTNDTSNNLLSQELEGRIEDALEQLPEKCGEVFRMSRFSELSYKEIAEKLGISVKTVENHMGKALRLMRNELLDYLPLIIVTILLSTRW